MAIGDDFSVAVNGDIRHIANTNHYTVLELHRWLSDLADDAAASTSGNDLVDIVSDTPSERITDNIINLLSTYNIDDDASEYFYAGSISQDSGNTVYSGLRVLGAVNVSATQLTVVQDHAFYDSPSAPFWGTQAGGGYNGNAAAGILMRILVKSRESGYDLDGQRIRVQARHYVTTAGDFFDFFDVALGTGEAVAAISTSDDPQNTISQVTVTAYTHIVNSGGTANDPTGGYQQIDIGDGNGNQPYYSKWTFGVDTSGDGLKGMYEYMKDLTRTASAKTVDAISGALFLGITHDITYDALSGAVNEREKVVWGTHIWYDALAGGTFTEGFYVLFAGGAAGKVVYDDAVDEFYIALEDISITVLDNEVITEYNPATGVASGVTAAVDTGTGGGSPIEHNDKEGGEGFILATDAGSPAGQIWIQKTHGLAPVNDSAMRTITSARTLNADTTIVARTIPKIFMGTFTGNIIGAYGLGIDQDDIAAPDTITDLDGDINSAPNNVTFTVEGLVSGEDRVLVGPKGTGNDFEKDQMTSTNTLNTASETNLNVGSPNIPADTPASGILRVELDVFTYRRITYTSHDGDDDFTLTDESWLDPNDSTFPKDVFLAYIDELASGATASFTTIYDSDRTLWVRVRDGGTAGDTIPIKTFESQATLGVNGGSITAIRTSDA